MAAWAGFPLLVLSVGSKVFGPEGGPWGLSKLTANKENTNFSSTTVWTTPAKNLNEQEMHSALKLSGKGAVCHHVDFSLLRPIPNSDLQIRTLCCLSAYIYGNCFTALIGT